MKSDVLCAIKISKIQYDNMVSRLCSYGAIANQIRQIVCQVYANPPPSNKMGSVKNFGKKYESALISLTHNNGSVYMFGKQGAIYNSKFILTSNLIRGQNNFSQMIKGWSTFSEMKQYRKRNIRIQTYEWQNMYDIEFYHIQHIKQSMEDENKPILLIMRDRSAPNLIQHYEKKKNKQKIDEQCSTRFVHHFQNVFAIFAAGYNQINPFLKGDALNQKAVSLFSIKIKQFSQFFLSFLQSRIQMSLPSSSALSQYWMIQAASIISFALQFDYVNNPKIVLNAIERQQ